MTSVSISSGLPNPSILFPTVVSPTVNPLSLASSISPLTPIYPSLSPIIPTVPTIASTLPSAMISPSTLYPYAPMPGLYPDVNSDQHLRKQVSEYFYNKVYNNWLKYQYLELYQMVSVHNGVASLSKHATDKENNQLKYDFIVKNFLSKNDIYTLLEKFRKINGINWWELKKNSDQIRKFIQHKVAKYMKNEVSKLK